jgi:hypothetical protein
MRKRQLAILVFGVILAAAGVMLGAWWVPFPVGVAIGVAEPRARIAIPLGAASGLVGWLVPLAQAQLTYGLGPTAGSIAAIMGFGHQGGAIPTVLTMLVGTLLGLTGAWLTTALRGVASQPR